MSNEREALAILLSSRKCWTNGQPEIAEEISAQFDISLDEARKIEALAAASRATASEHDLILEASELLDKHFHCNCKWDNGHEPTCAIVKAKDWRTRALKSQTGKK